MANQLVMKVACWRPRAWAACLVAVLVVTGVFTLSSAQATSAYQAQLALGQSSVLERIESPATMSKPASVFVDPAGHVLVSDQQNHRVLIWDTLPASSSTTPDRVLGQPNLASVLPNQGGLPSAATLSCPHGLWSDGSRVVVSDRGNDRVLVYQDLWGPDSLPMGEAADVVLGRSSMSQGTSRGCGSASPGIAGAATLSFPTGVSSDGEKLFVADTGNNRVLGWFSIPSSDGASADLALGQPSLTSNDRKAASASSLLDPIGVSTDGARLAVADTSNHRVLVYDPAPGPGDAHGMPADVAVGQANLSSSAPNGAEGFLSARTLSNPAGVALAAGRLLIADTGNNRVLMHRSVPTSHYATATDEIGHRRFTSRTAGSGDSGLSGPSGVALGAGRILVSDTQNHRGTVYLAPITASGSVTAAVSASSPLQITLSWGPVAGADSYRIFRDGFWYTDVSGATTSLADSQLSPVAYSYTVVPLTKGVEGEPLGTATQTPPAPSVMPQIVVKPHAVYSTYLSEGDSGSSDDPAFAPPDQLSDIWVEQIASYVGPANSVMAAVPGSTCVGTDPKNSMGVRIAAEIARYQPDLVTIGIGTNDLRLGYADTHGAVSMRSFRDCLRSSVAAAGPSASRTVVLLSAYEIENWDQMHPKLRYEGSDYIFGAGTSAKRAAWNKTIKDVGLHAGVPVADVSAATLSSKAKYPQRDVYMSDRIHSSQWGHDVIADSVLGKLLPYIGMSGGDPARLPAHPFTSDETVGNSSVEFTWEAPPAGAATYEVRWSPGTGVAERSAFTNSPAMRLELDADARWNVRVRALDAAGSAGPWSLNGRVVLDRVRPGQSVAPVAVPTRGTNRVMWTWNEPPDQGGISHYEVCGSRSPGVPVCSYFHKVPKTQYEQAGLSLGTWYLKVRAVDYVGNVGDYSPPGTWVSAGIESVG